MQNHNLRPKIERRKNGGQALLMTVVLFLFLSITFITGVSGPIIRHGRVTTDFLSSRKSYFLAESGLEDVIYRIKNNKQISTLESISLDGSSATTSISDALGTKTIETSANVKDLFRKTEVVLRTGVGSSFNYGIQSGAGGFILGNNAVVNGSVYSNGSIVGSNGSAITGSAISANSPALTADQYNDVPSTPNSSITFGDSSSNQDFAQSFKVSSLEALTKISLYIKKIGAPSNITVRIVTDSSGAPDINTITSATLSSSLVTSNYGWVDVSLPNYIQLTPGVPYWIVLDGVNSSSKYYILGANSSYGDGEGRLGQYGGTWGETSPSGLDGYFKIYLGGLTGLISGLNVGSGGVGNAEADQVTNTIVAGNIYCQTGSGNNKSCDTERPAPPSLDFPISDGNIDQWKDEAEAGGIINGDYLITSNVSLGPKKIIGNLSINNNAVVTITGTVWVTGNITISNNVLVKLSSAYGENSGVIVADGYFNVSNNSSFAGSGQSGSYIMAMTTSDCPVSSYCNGGYAMDISNNVGSVILNAQNGTIRMSNNAGAKQLTAYKIFFDNNTIINYEKGIANTNFTNGPTGGWNINSWAEIE